MTFNIEEYLNSLPFDVTEIELKNKDLTYIPDLSKFTNLKILNVSFNKITTLPPPPYLPDTLEDFNLYQNNLTTIHELPCNLKKFCCCHNNNLKTLSRLPNKLEFLCLYYNDLTCLPCFPDSLKTLYICYNDKLTSISSLPNNLEIFYCYNNKTLSSLPSSLPINLKKFDCSNCDLSLVPTLPNNLELFFCNNNKLTFLYNLPNNIELLRFMNNNISYVSNLPDKLKQIHYENNPIYEVIHKKIDIPKENIRFNDEYIKTIKKNIITIYNFRYIYYLYKSKKPFWDILWVKIREPKISEYYKPDNLIEKLKKININDEENEEIFDNLLNTW